MKIMIDSEYLDKLQKSLGVDNEGNAVVGKNLEVDGQLQVNDLSNGVWLGDPNGTSTFINIYKDLDSTGYFTIDVYADGESASYSLASNNDVNLYTILTPTLLAKTTKTLFGNQSIVGDGNIDLYRHSITLEGASGSSKYTANIEFISSKNLICDSVTDLKTLINDGTTYLSKIPTSITSGDTSTSGYVLVNSFMAKLSNNTNPSASLAEITTVSDTVTTI